MTITTLSVWTPLFTADVTLDSDEAGGFGNIRVPDGGSGAAWGLEAFATFSRVTIVHGTSFEP